MDTTKHVPETHRAKAHAHLLKPQVPDTPPALLDPPSPFFLAKTSPVLMLLPIHGSSLPSSFFLLAFLHLPARTYHYEIHPHPLSRKDHQAVGCGNTTSARRTADPTSQWALRCKFPTRKINRRHQTQTLHPP
jgi:hypothetical protein